MLQRAASNAYSWWMASHIRTKQSKWMEQNLQDMEEKVSAVLKLIEEDGDSFIQKANMYYKKRPEIINFVEEFFRAYRALADRYDHLSTELQNANNTIASICPDQVRGLDDDDDFDYAPRCPKMPSENTSSAPKVPKLPVKELKFIANTKKKVKEKKATKPAVPPVNKSGLTKEEGVGEIDRIQKRILALQTEKEFVKSSYESRLAKYREVENEIKEEQQKVNSLQDEFGEGKVIDDEEARNLMAATAFKSCKETLDKLKQAYERSAAQVEVEQKRITVSRGRVDALKKMFLSSESVAEVTKIAAESAKKRGANVDNISQKPKVDMESEAEAEAEAGDGDSEADVPEKIDVLVNKVTSLETTTSSQEALVQRLKSENDELQGLIQSFEEGKANLVDGNQDLKMKIIHLELKWQGVQDLNHSIENQKTTLQSRFIDAHSNLDEISHNIKPVENLKTPKSSSVLSNNETKEKPKKAKAGKEFLKPKAGKEFLKPRVTTSPAEAESEKGSEEHVATNKADASKELYSVPVSANAAASKELNSVAKSVVDGAGASKELNSVAKSAVDGAGASKELNSVAKSAVDGAGASKELNSVAKSAVDGVGASKELNSVPVSANADTYASKELNSVAKSAVDGGARASKDLNSVPVSANADAYASKELNSVAKSAVDGGARASKDLNSVPVSANADAYASKELNSVAKSAVDGGARASKDLNSVPVSANADAYASKELNSVAKSAVDGGARASKDLNSVPVSANADAYASKELNSVAKSTVDGGARASKELNSVPKSANDGVTDASKELNSVPKSANDGVTDASKELHSIPTPANEGIESPKVSETSDHLIAMAKVVGQASSLIANKVSKSDSKEHELAALSLTLEETKKKLMEVETNHQNELFEITLQLKELKNLNAKKDEVIRSLRLKLSRGKPKDEGTNECQACSEKLPESETKTTEAPQPVEKEEDNDSITIPKPVNDPEPTSVIEEKFRTDIDELLEENLDFWYRFSSTLCEIQKYQTGVKDLETEVLKLEERQKNEGSSTSRYSVKSDVRPLYKHLREMQTELSLWIEKSMSLKDELKNSSSSLCEIQEEITKALKASAEDEEFRFTSFQAAKFQGEILNMKQENNRVGDELQAGLELATSLQRDAERALAKLSDDWGLSGSRNRQGGSAEVRSNVPLRSFIFGVKQKKQKTSIFSVVQPALQKKQNKPGNSSSGK